MNSDTPFDREIVSVTYYSLHTGLLAHWTFLDKL
jgi:hypothetical protein